VCVDGLRLPGGLLDRVACGAILTEWRKEERLLGEYERLTRTTESTTESTTEEEMFPHEIMFRIMIMGGKLGEITEREENKNKILNENKGSGSGSGSGSFPGGGSSNLARGIEALSRKEAAILAEVKKLEKLEEGLVKTKVQREIDDLASRNKDLEEKVDKEARAMRGAAKGAGGSAREGGPNGMGETTEEDKRTLFMKIQDEQNVIRTLREDIRRLRDEQGEMESKLKLVRSGEGDHEELTMGAEDKEEKDENLRRMRRSVRMFQRAIKQCRGRWDEMKKEGIVQGGGGLKAKLQKAKTMNSVMKAFGAKGGNNAFGGQRQGGEGEGMGTGTGMGIGLDGLPGQMMSMADVVVKSKEMQLALGNEFSFGNAMDMRSRSKSSKHKTFAHENNASGGEERGGVSPFGSPKTLSPRMIGNLKKNLMFKTEKNVTHNSPPRTNRIMLGKMGKSSTFSPSSPKSKEFFGIGAL